MRWKRLSMNGIIWFKSEYDMMKYTAINSIVSFEDTVEACMGNTEFMTQYDRLNGTNLTKKLSPVNNQIDKVSGLRESELKEFFDAIRELIYMPALKNAITQIKDGRKQS
jgi:predicted xylose isomerase-like sugar epimerase